MENTELTYDELDDLIYSLRYIRDVSESNEKEALKCIQRAINMKEPELEAKARLSYINQVIHLNKHELGIAMFPSVLKYCDETQDYYIYYSTLWTYKWIIEHIKGFSKISLQKIEELYNDMEKRFIDYGATKKVIHYFKVNYYIAIGEIDKAKLAYKNYKLFSKESTLEDCKACQRDSILNYLNVTENYKEFFKVAQVLIDKIETCAEVPAISYPKILLASINSKKWEQAAEFELLTKKAIKFKHANLEEAYPLVIYYAITNDFLKARNLVEKQISFALLNGNEIDRFKFFLSFGLLLTKIKQNGKTKLKLKLPENLNISNSSNEYLIEDLLNFADSKVKEYASAFDKRNANNYYTQEIETFYNKYLTLKV